MDTILSAVTQALPQPKPPGYVGFLTLFIAGLGCVFAGVAIQMLFVPQHCLTPLGVDYSSQGVSGRAELRAYYLGSSLCLSLSFFRSLLLPPSLDGLRWALIQGALVLGGFAASRVASYVQEGRDYDDPLRAADATFVVEVIGTVVALAFLGTIGKSSGKGRRKQ